MTEKEAYISTSISFRKDILQKADKIVKDKLIDGVHSRSALVEFALGKVFKEVLGQTNQGA